MVSINQTCTVNSSEGDPIQNNFTTPVCYRSKSSEACLHRQIYGPFNMSKPMWTRCEDFNPYGEGHPDDMRGWKLVSYGIDEQQ